LLEIIGYSYVLRESLVLSISIRKYAKKFGEFVLNLSPEVTLILKSNFESYPSLVKSLNINKFEME